MSIKFCEGGVINMQNIDLERDERVIVIANAGGISVTEVMCAINRFSNEMQQVAKVFREIIDSVAKIIRKIYEEIKEIYIDELDCDYQTELYKLNFQRPKIQHQVLDRKPRNLIKKII